MLEITSLTGESELLSGYVCDSLTINKAVNGNRSLSFLLPRTDANQHAFGMVDEEAVLTYDGHDYRIKTLEERAINGTPVKSVVAPHVFFDLVDEQRYTRLTNGFKSIAQVLDFIFAGTDWTFTVIDSYDTAEFENFGNDNCLALFNKVLERFGAEFDLNGREVIIRNQIGIRPDLQFRYNHNVKTFKRKLDTSNLSTYIRGTGKRNEDGTYVVEAEYTSPNANVFGIKHAQPYSNESITHEATLLRNMKRAIQDTPELTIELDFAVLRDAGYLAEKPGLGDIVPTIYEPLSIDLDLRVMDIEDYPESNKAPKVTLATTKQSYAKAVMNYQKTLLDRIYDENSGRLRYNVYDEAVKRATEALNNSLTELEYPANMGIIARDPNNPLRFVALRSSGLGVTVDGGQTFKEAITADGVTTSLLTAGQIKTNNVQIIGNDDLFYWDGTALMAISATDANKYVKLNSEGLYVAKGALTIERPDGAKFIQNGLANFDYNVQEAEPAFQEAGVTISTRFWKTVESSSEQTVNAYSFRHEGSVLCVSVNHMLGQDNDTSGGVYVRGFGEGGDSINAAVNFSNYLEENGYETIRINIGKPTYQQRQFYLKIKSGGYGKSVFLRKLRIWQED